MSHTTPAIAITELQGQLADAKTEVADSLSYLTDCRTTVAASSFATVMGPVYQRALHQSSQMSIIALSCQ